MNPESRIMNDQTPTPETDADRVTFAEGQVWLDRDGDYVNADVCARIERGRDAARAALKDIAGQLLADEMDDHSAEHADWEGGYEACIKTAREALAPNPGSRIQ